MPRDESQRLICITKAGLAFNKLFLVAYGSDNDEISTMQIVFIILSLIGFVSLGIITFSYNFKTSWKYGLRKKRAIFGDNGYLATHSKDDVSMTSSIFPKGWKTTLSERNKLWGKLKRPYLFLFSYLFGFIMVQLGLFIMMILAITFYQRSRDDNNDESEHYLYIGLGHVVWIFAGLYLDNECARFLDGYEEKKKQYANSEDENGNLYETLYATNIGSIFSVNGIVILAPFMFGICVISVGYLIYCFSVLGINYATWTVILPILMALRTILLSLA